MIVGRARAHGSEIGRQAHALAAAAALRLTPYIKLGVGVVLAALRARVALIVARHGRARVELPLRYVREPPLLDRSILLAPVGYEPQPTCTHGTRTD